MRPTYKELIEMWSLLDFSNEIEHKKYDPRKAGVTIFKAVTDFLIVLEAPKATYVICTGSNTGLSFKAVVEWFTNLHAWNKRGFHKGFYNVANRMYKQLKDYKWNHNKQVYYVLHSRGVYGSITALKLREKGFITHPIIVSFGAPECCKDEGIQRMKDAGIEHYRVLTPDDMITKVGASKHYETEVIELPVVKGIDHISYEEALQEAIRLEEKTKELTE